MSRLAASKRHIIGRLSCRVLSLVIGLGVALGVGVFVTPVEAHNRDKTSEPVNGAVLETAPPKITFWFKQPVGTDSATVFLIEPSGTRTRLEILAAGQFEIVAALPPLPAGVYSVRWKLISTDGHPVTNKVSFTVTKGVVTEIAATGVVTTGIAAEPAPPLTTSLAATTAEEKPSATSAEGETAGIAQAAPDRRPLTPATIPPPGTPSIAVPTPVAASTTLPSSAASGNVDAGSTDTVTEESGGAPNVLRWLLRFASYLAGFAFVGCISARRLIWNSLFSDVRLIKLLNLAAALIAALALLQLLILVHDIDAGSWSASFKRVHNFDLGIALVIRIVLGLIAMLLIRRWRANLQAIEGALMAVGIGLLAAWAYAGHAKSQRWPVLGLPIDVLHHGASATWIAALAIGGFVAFSRNAASVELAVLERVSTTAMFAVVVVISTGFVQSIRLVGGPMKLWTGGHSQLVAVKIFVVTAMLILAELNRQATLKLAVEHDFVGHDVHDVHDPKSERDPLFLRRFRNRVVVEFALGMLAVAVTSSLVVRQPSWSNDAPLSKQPSSLTEGQTT